MFGIYFLVGMGLSIVAFFALPIVFGFKLSDKQELCALGLYIVICFIITPLIWLLGYFMTQF